jgi:uncharacterized membrane protein YraQ (UPF0718 family)
MMAILKSYRYTLAIIGINLILLIVRPEFGLRAFRITESNSIEILMNIPAIFILLGLLDIWIKKETMMKILGNKSGLLGIFVAFLLGSIAAGPMYATFPIAGTLISKGARFFNIIIFVGAWSTTKIPMLLFETSAMGWRFMLARLIIDIPVVIIIAFITERVVMGNEIELIHDNIMKLTGESSIVSKVDAVN